MKNTAKVLVALALVGALASCDLIELLGLGGTPKPLTAPQRVEAFITDANAAERSASGLQAHFHGDTAERPVMAGLTYWNSTVWAESNAPFALINVTAAETVSVTIGSTTYDNAQLITADLTHANTDADGYPISIWLLPNASLDGDYLIRKIEVDIAGTISEIKNIF